MALFQAALCKRMSIQIILVLLNHQGIADKANAVTEVLVAKVSGESSCQMSCAL